MSKSDAFEAQLLNHIFKNSELSAITAGVTSLWVSLHTGDPGEAGNQTTSEPTYEGYVRSEIARSAVGFTVTAAQAYFMSALNFAAAVSADGTISITHFGIGTASGGAGVLLYSGTVTPAISITTGVTPQLTAATKVTET
jgi:hypothetical protein